MSIAKEFSASVGVTINLGSYESYKVELSETHSIEDGEDVTVAKQNLYDKLSEEVLGIYRKVHDSLKKVEK